MSGLPGPREPGPLVLHGRSFPPGRLLVMAIVNRTPDAFYRPRLTWDEGAALERVHQVVAEGADILDVCTKPMGRRDLTPDLRTASQRNGPRVR